MHAIDKISFDTKMSKEKIEKECNDIAKRSGEYGGKLPGKIQWHDITFDNINDARKHIDKIDRDYAQLAVKYLDYPSDIKPSSKMISLKERREKEIEKYQEYSQKHSVKSFKAALVGCPNCGSKLNKEYLNNEKCPLCRTDLRSKTTLETLERYNKNIADLEKQYIEENKKNQFKNKKKAIVKWLVKIEYHC